VALRIAETPPPELVGRRVARVACAVFGSERYLQGRATKDLNRLDWVGWPVSDTSAFATWMREQLPRARVALRVQNTWAVRDAVDADLGVALLPCALGDARPGWRRVRFIPEIGGPLWILTHRDLRATARVRVLREVLWEELSRLRALYEGTSVASPRPKPSSRRAGSG
jgi:DNA-binding transcriptional LysR family regulator